MNLFQRLELWVLRFYLPSNLFETPERRISRLKRRLSARYAALLYLSDRSAEMVAVILEYYIARAKKEETPYGSLVYRMAAKELEEFLVSVHKYSGCNMLSIKLKEVNNNESSS